MPGTQRAQAPMSGLALQGFLLFLFIPLVLFLFLGQPLGPEWSVSIGIAIMLGHRVVAQPWMAKFADVRCLWCGRVRAETQLEVWAGGRQWTMSACSKPHADKVARFLHALDRFRRPIAAGIFAPLAWLIVATVAEAAGRPLLPHAVNASIFRLVVAVTVIAAATAPIAVRTPPAHAGTLRCPFPLHNLFLLGIGNTLWIFRVVGAWWIADALLRLVR